MPNSMTAAMSGHSVDALRVAEAETRSVGLPTILYIDEKSLTRDCIGRELASQFAELAIEPAASIRDIEIGSGAERRFALAVINTHMANIADCAVAAELSLIGQAMPEVPVVLLSDSEMSENIVGAFGRGVRGYVPTSLTMKSAAAAIRFVWEGGTFVPPSALTASARLILAESSAAAGRKKPSGKFTPRQREVLARLWQGKPNKAIAYDLNMCESTVKIHVRHIMKKLHARNRTQIVLLTHPGSHDETAMGIG